MNDGEDNILIEAHRFSRQAEEALKKGHWQQAIDRHTRAAQNFRCCVGLTSHPAGDKAIQQLVDFHTEAADKVRARLQPQSTRTLHFVSQPPLLIHSPANSVSFAVSESEKSQTLESFQAKPTEIAPAIINIQIQTMNPMMTAKSQAHVNKLESLLSQLSEVCQSDPSNRISKETVQLFVTEMREQLHGLCDNSPNAPTGPPALKDTNTSSSEGEQRKLAEQVGTLEQQLAEERALRHQLQHKLEKTETIVAKHKKRWQMLQEAAKKKEFGEGKEP